MASKSILIPRDLHARPATLLIQKTQAFPDTRIYLLKDNKKIEANSLIGILSLGMKQGDTVTIETEGEKSEEALNVLSAFLQEGLCQNG